MQGIGHELSLPPSGLERLLLLVSGVEAASLLPAISVCHECTGTR